MDHLWSPWRYQYVQRTKTGDECIFCRATASDEDQENLLVYRGQRNFAMLNLYPYTTGHLMVVPYQHVNNLEDADVETLQEMILLVRQSQCHLRKIYEPAGFNLGMNLGESAGAGIAEHIHMHVLPRWPGDTNFMTTVGETRVLPEALTDTWRKLRAAFAGAT
jgi:ATP adenylyltransferase